MSEHKAGDTAYIGNPIIMNGDSNLHSKNDADACFRRLKLMKNDPVTITAVHRSKAGALYDVIYNRDGVDYRISNLPEFNLWTKKGWDMYKLLESRNAK